MNKNDVPCGENVETGRIIDFANSFADNSPEPFVKRKPYRDGWYKGYYLQSSFELIWAAWMILVKQRKFERNTTKYPYIFKGETLFYIPDFRLEDGSYVETKGTFNDQELAKWRAFRALGNKLEVFLPKEIRIIEQELRDHLSIDRNQDICLLLYEEKPTDPLLIEPKLSITINGNSSTTPTSNSDKPQRKAKFFAFDTETGGLNPTQHSLLTFHGIFLDENLEMIDEIGFLLRNDGEGEGTYSISAGALKTNKIDLVEHAKRAIPYSVAGKLLKQKFEQICGPSGKYGTRLFGMGQNIAFDYGFIRLLGRENYDPWLNNGNVDLYTLSIALQSIGVLPVSLRLKLEPLCQHFGIDATFHNAKEDIHATVKVIKILLGLLKEYLPRVDKKYLEAKQLKETTKELEKEQNV